MSKGLEALTRISKGYIDTDDVKTIWKELKALEIIKEKEVSLMRLRLTKNYEHYNLIYIIRKQLSEGEYKLLKGVLNET